MGSDTGASLVVYEHFAAGAKPTGEGGAAEARRREHGGAGGPRVGEERGSLRAEGEAMLGALLEDLAAARPAGLALHAVLPADADVPLPAGVGRLPPARGSVPFPLRGLPGPPRLLLWPIAPETRGTLERLVAGARQRGLGVVGPSPEAVRRASGRAQLAGALEARGLPVPAGRPAHTPAAAREAAREVGWPVVVKPGRGAGAAGVTRVARDGALEEAWRRARRVEPGRPPLVQALVEGAAASVALLVRDGEPEPLALNRQLVRFGPEARYRGGSTPFEHPAREAALAAAAAACRAVPGLRGLVGVDLVLSPGGPVVMELNPRLTTSYLGLRARFGPELARRGLVAGLAGDAGGLPREAAGAGLPSPSAPAGGEPVRYGPGGERP